MGRNAPSICHPLLLGADVSCGAGWFNLLNVLSNQLQKQTDRHGAPQLQVVQVKEKLGTLSFHTTPCSETQNALIGMAMHLSACMCEICGKPGYLREDRPLIKTLCDEHATHIGQPF